MTNDNDFDEEKSLLEKLRESPRTVSALVIIVVVAAAIYAFSGDNDGQDEIELANEDGIEVALEGENNEEAMEDGEGEAMVAGTMEPVEATTLAEQAATLPAEERSDESYVETAQAGDGITHLSRRATTRWLTKNSASFEVTNEHRIYIEDYIQNKIGRDPLAIGEQHSIPFSLVEEAVAAAGNLSSGQLQNLTKYTHNVSF